MADSPAAPPPPLAEKPSSRAGTIALVVVAVVAVAFAAWRSTLGASLFDDAYYTLMSLRIAQGVKPIADEFTLQTFGFFVPAAAAKLWVTLFGVRYLALYLRLFYVALATATWYVGFRMLRPTFGTLASAVGMAAPLLAPPYGVLMASYNTMCELGFILAATLGFAALRDGDRRVAAAAGVALAVGAISYPPTAIPAFVLAVTFAALAWARNRRELLLPALAGAAVPALALVAWLLVFTSPSQIATALSYSRAAQEQVGSLASRVRIMWAMMPQVVFARRVWLLWVAAALACLGGRYRRVGGVAAILLPLAAFYPGYSLTQAHWQTRIFGATLTAYLLYVTVAGSIPVVVRAWRDRDSGMQEILRLVGPSAIVGVPVVAYSTSSGFYRGLALVGGAALAVVVVAGLARLARGAHETWGPIALVIALLACQVWLLTATTFDDAPPPALKARVADGALAGLATHPMHRKQFAEVTALGKQLVRRDATVLVDGSPGLYLLLPGTPLTNAGWLVQGPSDAATVRYFQTKGQMPDDIFILAKRVTKGRAVHDPLIVWVDKNYRAHQGIPGFVLFRRR